MDKEYKKIKYSDKKTIRYNAYRNLMFNTVINWFQCDSTIDFDYKHAIEYMLDNGYTAITLENDNGKKWFKAWSVTVPDGVINCYDFYDTFNVSDSAGNTRTVTHLKDCIILQNGFFHAPEWQIFNYIDMLVECDTSTDATLIHTRLAPVFTANSEATANRLKTVYHKLKDGEFDVVVSKNINNQVNLSDILNSDTSKEVTKIDWYDVKNINTIQYLSEFHNAIMSRFFTEYGSATNISLKHAQQSSDELNSFEIPSLILILDKLKSVQEFTKNIELTFNEIIDMKLTDVYKAYIDSIIKRRLEGSEEDVKTNNGDN